MESKDESQRDEGMPTTGHDDLLAIVSSLMELTEKISKGDFDQAEKIYELTREGKYPPLILHLAEAFGMMMVQVEARQYHLEQINEDLAVKNRALKASIEKIRLLEIIKSHMGKFVPSSVLTLIEKNPDSPDLLKREEDVSVVFLDIAGYTKMSEQLEPEKVNTVIQTYFSSFMDAIFENNGDINETAGDGLMIIFRDKDPAKHALNAVQAAIDIQNRAQAIDVFQQELREAIQVHVGINSGLCSVGSNRFEGVTGTRWTFTATGPVTNTAARICSLTSGGDILVGADTHERIKNHFSFEPAGEHMLKNISRPVKVFKFVGSQEKNSSI